VYDNLMPLTLTQIHNLKAKDKLYRLLDGHGLYLEVAKSGTKTWIHRYRFNQKATMRTLGHFPEMSINEAREVLYQDKSLLTEGINPNKPSLKGEAEPIHEDSTFQEVFEEWYAYQFDTWTYEYAKDVKERAVNYLMPDLASRPIKAIKTPELVRTLKKMERKGVLDTMNKVKSIAKRVFSYATGMGVIEYNPVLQIPADIFKKKKNVNYAHITDERELRRVMKKIHTFLLDEHTNAVNIALFVLPHLFVRPNELCGMRWEEVDFNNRLIRISAERMKMRIEHIIPLSDIMFDTFLTLYDTYGKSEYVFPSPYDWKNQPISPNALLRALRRIGVDKKTMTLHGFRHTASTMLNEKGYPPDIIEKQLSHTDRNTVRGTYNKSVYLDARREMMKGWSSYLLSFLN